MKRRAFAIVTTVLAFAACQDMTTSVPSTMNTAVDRDGLADLIVDQLDLATSLRINVEKFEASSCSAVEGHFAGGTYRTLRFAVTTPNVGDADVVVGDPGAHIDPNA